MTRRAIELIRSPDLATSAPYAYAAVASDVSRLIFTAGRRGHGLGGRILAALEAEARALGARRIVLESGVRQGPALALYATAGFTSIEPYGEFLRPELEAHVKAGISVYMGKDLGPGGRP